MALWGGRFSEPTDADLRTLNDSIGFDVRMFRQDIRGSVAYAKALADADVISHDEAEVICNGLEQVLEEFETDRFVFADGDEDIHTAVERRLIELVGAVGGKLHTGRSRNDQVATDFRLWVMDAIDEFSELLVQFQTALVTQAELYLETVMPGYTHMQPAQPITVAHWLMSFFWMNQRNMDRLNQTRERTAVSPLGSGALAGTPFTIDRETLAQSLGFSSYSQNSLDAVSDRDFVAETLFCLSMIGIHLSRLAEDIIYYSNPSFGLIILNDRYSTGSSLMPQKRNADPMELARGKSGRLIGHLTGLLTTLKGLPSGYNKDLQEDKEALFDAFDTLNTLLPVVIAVISTLQINEVKLGEALSDDMLATDLADYLVAKGVPFREAHHIVGQVVQKASNYEISLSQLSTEQLQEISSLFGNDVSEVFDFKQAVARRSTAGGTAPSAVQQQMQSAREWLSDF